jgi:hypothetical protein
MSTHIPGEKVRPGRDADHSPPSSAGHGKVELYLYPPSGPHRVCNRVTLPYMSTHTNCTVLPATNTVANTAPSQKVQTRRTIVGVTRHTVLQ